ncbi:Uncharacterized protein HZ326_7473 [Fusarium oxysporum f. sp. albedinis]|nr:Uncharacterized protein HZ326_7473 [Fusarium oxysporum f. sp. albedinis]
MIVTRPAGEDILKRPGKTLCGILEALAVTGCMLTYNLDAFRGLRRHHVWDLIRDKHLLIIQTNIASHRSIGSKVY